MNPLKKIISNKWTWIIAALIAILLCALFNKPHFKSVTLEVGSSEVNETLFFREGTDPSKAEVLSDLSIIDLNVIGSYPIEIVYNGRHETVRLFVTDTTAPVVQFKNVFCDVDYIFDVNDFIISKSDATQMIVSTDFEGFSDYGVYEVNISVADEGGNITSQQCTLEINWLRSSWQQELGEEINFDNILLKPEYADRLNLSQCEKVDIFKVGDYTVTGQYGSLISECVISVTDTIAPTLILRNIEREGANNYKDITAASFVVSLFDASKECEWKVENEPDFSVIGTQTIEFTATDSSGNVSVQYATYTLTPDRTAPVIYGLSTIGVNKHGSCDFVAGVSAVDAIDGSVSFSYDASKVNFDVYGTYFVYYTAADSLGNSVTSRRKVEVYHDEEDTAAAFDIFYDQYLKGLNAKQMADVIHDVIRYSGACTDDPVWQGLTNRTGDCYVHATMLDAAYAKAGWGHCIVTETYGRHYWNLCNQTGYWRHYDSTPTMEVSNHGPMDNTQRKESALFKRKSEWVWDESLYPEVIDEPQ